MAPKEAEGMRVDPLFAQRLPGKKGGYVDIHVATDKNKKQEHLDAALVLADKGNQVKLMPEIHIKDTSNRRLFFPELAQTSGSNPDARFNGILGDFKIPDSNPVTGKAILNAVKATADKDVSICAISLLNRSYSHQEVLSHLRGALKNPNNHQSITAVWIIGADKSVLKIPRGVIMHKDFWKMVKHL